MTTLRLSRQSQLLSVELWNQTTIERRPAGPQLPSNNPGRVLNLRVPGPTPLPPSVLAAQAGPMFDHRGPEFHDLYEDIQVRLPTAMRTAHPCLLVLGGGTSAMEAAVWSLTRPGDIVAVACNGYFARRFHAQIASAGVRAELFDSPMGQPIDLNRFEEFLRTRGRMQAVFLVAHETCSGMVNDLSGLACVVRAEQPDALLVVDVVSLAPLHEFDADTLDIDVLVASSTKAMMGSPGLGIVTLSPRAQGRLGTRVDLPSTLDLEPSLRFHARSEMPYTPPVTVVADLSAALRVAEAEGIASMRRRHRSAAAYTRRVLGDARLTPVTPAAYASPTVTAAWIPPGVSAQSVVKLCREQFGVVFGTGRVPDQDRIVRIAHMGWFTAAEIQNALTALVTVVGELDHPRTGLL